MLNEDLYDGCHQYREQVVVIGATKIVDISLRRPYYGSFRSIQRRKEVMKLTLVYLISI